MTKVSPESTRSLVRSREFRFQRLRVSVTRGPNQGLERDIDNAEFRIGTASDGDLVLTDDSVSKYHCLVRASPAGIWLIDQESKNGSYVRGHRVGSVQITDATSVSMGSSTLTFNTLSEEVKEALSEDDCFDVVLGTSVAMRRIFAALPRVAASESTLLLEGETGTGKGLLAHSVHRASPRASGPFVVLDCSAIPPTLIESELFGHIKGSFTGATANRPGAFEAARGGTIFLDEIGELPLELQPKLLRALEERTIKRIGSVETVKVDARIIAATNRDLRREVEVNRFRADLFYRLNVLRIRLPPLRERKEDIPLLVARFYREATAGSDESPPFELLQSFLTQAWPGNVRELRSAVERAILMQDPALWEYVTDSNTPSTAPDTVKEVDLPFRAAKDRAIGAWERSYLQTLISSTAGNISAAARRARMDRNYLRELLAKHGLASGDTASQ